MSIPLRKITVDFLMLGEQLKALIDINDQVKSPELEGIENLLSGLMRHWEYNRDYGHEDMEIDIYPVSTSVINKPKGG